MHKALILAAGLALAATSAWSQGSSRDRDDDYDGGRRDWHESRSDWRGGSDDRRGHRMRDHMRDDDDDERSEGRGARFFLRSGDTQLRAICGDRESTQACVDAALRMFDRVQSQSGGTSRPSSPPSSTAPSTPQ